ncbi:hypothetical protein ZWY2020_032729 [Hordeum vulgare]|nr:hypothetical protein ZWY2020_057623 [Hordeum vulgare]KAI5005486.1 hypothetical protein ZWY2020_032729 [Hordeum vulgare]
MRVRAGLPRALLAAGRLIYRGRERKDQPTRWTALRVGAAHVWSSTNDSGSRLEDTGERGGPGASRLRDSGSGGARVESIAGRAHVLRRVGSATDSSGGLPAAG